MGGLSTSTSKTTFTTSSADQPPKNGGCGITETDLIYGQNNLMRSTLTEEQKLKQMQYALESEPANHKR